MNEQEFIIRMKNKGTKLTDQQLKNEYRNYLKNPDSFGDLAADKKSDPFLEGLAGTAGPDAGTVKSAVKPSDGQAAIKQRYMQDETIEPKPKITLPTINKAQRINTVLGLGDAASFPQELAEAKREADARAKATQQSTIDFDNWAKMEQFNKKKREIQFNTSMTMEERDQAIHKLRNELLFKNNEESLNIKEPPSPAQDMGKKEAKKYLDDVIA